MAIDLTTETLWQENSNSVWFTNIKPICDLCGKKSELVIEFKVSEEDDGTRACFHGARGCMQQAMALLFAQNSDIEHLWTREIQYKAIGGKVRKKGASKREPIGLSKRYAVMRRDSFQCCLCGASGKDAKLEIDHIKPVSAGGNNSMDNLRTLCFKCNRGKSDTIE